MDWLEEATQPVFDRLTALGRNKLAQMYRACFRSTWDTTLQRSDGTVFLVTGDIPAMWLRDSSAQVYHYVPHAGKYREVSEAILGLLERQFRYIILDPYANAFNREANDHRSHLDDTSWTEEARPWIWERKYEVDSLCYPGRRKRGPGSGNANMKWTPCAIRSAWLTISGKQQAPLPGAAIPSCRRRSRSFPPGKRNSTMRSNPCIISAGSAAGLPTRCPMTARALRLTIPA